MQTITTNTQPTTVNLFPNLFSALKDKMNVELQETITKIRQETEITTFTAKYGWYSDLTPAGKKFNGKEWTLEKVKDYFISRATAKCNKGIEKKLAHLETVSKAGELTSAKITVEWKRSRMWGMNPTAEIRTYNNGEYEGTYQSGSIGGCGYDKLSTAIAEAMNQSNSFLKAMYLIKETNPTGSNREIFGYGSGYGILPALEGGVGVSCYPTIFKTIGLKFETVASGKTFDVYSVSKL